MRTSRNGSAFIGCSNYPECRYTRPLAGGADGELAGLDGKVLGTAALDGAVFEEEADAQPVTLKKGPYGFYVQFGEGAEGEKPRRASIPKGMDPAALDLERALRLLSLPRLVGPHPEDGAPVEAGIGRFGPFVKWGKTYANIRDPEEVFTIGMNRAVELLAQKSQRGGRGAAAKPLRELGEHPDGGPVAVYAGRYGPYVKWEKVNATLPKEIAPESVTLATALELIAAKAPAKRAPRAAAKSPARQTGEEGVGLTVAAAGPEPAPATAPLILCKSLASHPPDRCGRQGSVECQAS